MIYTVVFLLFLLFIVFSILHEPRDKCFDARAKEGLVSKNGCQGLVGGTKWTGYLQEECIDCPYYMNNIIGRKKNKK